ncbi:hypothetical protein DSECCO2_435110 [anaerobic digester metagenome]
MRLVDGDEPDVRPGEEPEEGLLHRPFGRDVENLDAAFEDHPLDDLLLPVPERAVDRRCSNTVRPEAVDLVLHQGDER